MKIVYISIATLALLQIGLVANILFLRNRHAVYVGAPDDGDHPLFRARLAHSNATEYTPMLCLLMMSLEHYGHQFSVMPWVYGVAVASRFAHALGLLNSNPTRPNPFRLMGMVGTLITMTAMSLSLLWQAGHGLLYRSL